MSNCLVCVFLARSGCSPDSPKFPSLSFGFAMAKYKDLLRAMLSSIVAIHIIKLVIILFVLFMRLPSPTLTPQCSLFRGVYLPPDALRAIVDIFYERLVVDERVMFFFEGVSVSDLKRQQYTFFEVLFTGTEVPADMDSELIDKHTRLFNEQGLNGAHIDIFSGHLVAALQQLHIPENLIGEVLNILGPLRAAFDDDTARVANAKKK
jgi:truncated hemoglobin YjbI